MNLKYDGSGFATNIMFPKYAGMSRSPGSLCELGMFTRYTIKKTGTLVNVGGDYKLETTINTRVWCKEEKAGASKIEQIYPREYTNTLITVNVGSISSFYVSM